MSLRVLALRVFDYGAIEAGHLCAVDRQHGGWFWHAKPRAHGRKSSCHEWMSRGCPDNHVDAVCYPPCGAALKKSMHGPSSELGTHPRLGASTPPEWHADCLDNYAKLFQAPDAYELRYQPAMQMVTLQVWPYPQHVSEAVAGPVSVAFFFFPDHLWTLGLCACLKPEWLSLWKRRSESTLPMACRVLWKDFWRQGAACTYA